MKYILEKPDLSKLDNEKIIKCIFEEEPADRYLKAVHETISPTYLYWDKVQYRPLPPNLTKVEFWGLVKFYRTNLINRKKSLVKTEKGEYFNWAMLPGMEEFFHDMDLNMGGRLLALTEDIDEKKRYKFISRGVMEEAIASSQLEGADTTREVAKRLLREGRKPRTVSEQMIVNNYAAMKLVEQELKDKKLTPAILQDLQAMLVNNTDVQKEEIGRLRTDKDQIVVADRLEDIVYHEPPTQAFLEVEIKKLIAFANDEIQTSFIHPIVKAVILHFWIGYLHPFTEGNGRLARVIFYWYLLKKGYWAFAFMPISKAIKTSPSEYKFSYIYSEQDDNDLTYFIDYNVRKIKIARKQLDKFMEEKEKDNALMRKLSRSKYNLNDRQIQLLQYYYKNKDETTSLKTHVNINNISRLTASKDLKALVKYKFIEPKKRGRQVLYFATKKVEELFSHQKDY